MRIRTIAFIYTLIVLLVMSGAWIQLKKEDGISIDMVDYNEALQLIGQEVEQDTQRVEIEEKYQCQMLYLSDADYQSRLSDALKTGGMIMDYYRNGEMYGKVVWNTERETYDELRGRLLCIVFWLCIALLCAGYLMLGTIYHFFIMPFQNLQRFSSQVAKGNLDMPLKMEKHNFFGAFTESFDIMREELKRAKESEYEANKSKKELVAQLSHDIKTPVSTIKATCEVIRAKENNQELLEKMGVILNKAEMIDNLVENMFHATLEELQALKVEVTEESSLCMEKMFHDLKYYGEVQMENQVPECLLYMDKLRLGQVIDNVVNNSFKYAQTAVSVSFEEKEQGICVIIRDWGDGIAEEELVLVKEKFYRGSNTDGKTGSGLGLYLADVFMNQMQGGMECYNQNGFVVVLFLKKAGKIAED